MSNTILWSSPSALTTLLTTELNSFASGTGVITSAITNETSKYQYMSLELVATWGSSPTNGYISVYLLSTMDGTNYSDGAAPSTLPHSSTLKINIPLRATTNQQRVIIDNIAIPPYYFKLFLVSVAGQTMASSGNTLKVRYYNHEVN